MVKGEDPEPKIPLQQVPRELIDFFEDHELVFIGFVDHNVDHYTAISYLNNTWWKTDGLSQRCLEITDVNFMVTPHILIFIRKN